MEKEISLVLDTEAGDAKRIKFYVSFIISISFCAVYCYRIVDLKSFIYCAICCLLVTVLYSILAGRKAGMLILSVSLIVTAIVIALLFWNDISGAFIRYFNTLIDAWNQKNGSMIYLYGTRQDSVVGMTLLVILATIILSAVTNILVRKSYIPVLVVFEFLFFAIYVIRSVKVSVWEILVFALVVSVTIISDILKSSFGKRIIYASTIMMLIIAFVITTVAVISRYVVKDFMKNYREEMIYRIEDRIYGKSDLCDGRLDKLGDKPQGNSTRLEFESSQDGCDLYLKGYTGGRYYKNEWKDLSVDAYNGDNMEMLHWISEHKESPLTMLSIFYIISEEYDEETFNYSIKNYKIINTGASTRYLYIPYTCTNARFSYYDDIYKDLMVKNKDREVTYSGGYLDINFNSFVHLKNNGALSDTDTINRYSEHFQCEQEYREYVKKYYLEVPKNVSEVFDGIFEKRNVNVAEAVFGIRSYLIDNMTYNETPTKLPKGEDFIEYYLTVAKEGYSVHYASIATLLFRYFGIPARYAEGYLGHVVDGKVSICESDAHAWVEIYRYGMGWVPIEVTPGYYEVDAYEETYPQSIVKPRTPDVQTLERPKSGTDNNGVKKVHDNSIKVSLQMIIILLVILLLVILLIILIRRWIILMIRKHRFIKFDMNSKALFTARYIYLVANSMGIGIDRSNPGEASDKMDDSLKENSGIVFDSIVELLNRARYSQETIGVSEIDKACEYYRSEKKIFRKNVRPLKYLFAKYIKVIV